ncbi:hypothetical protein B0H65DRAFT_109232 [Neurospora tetraspora]|uniref:Secreted protein n=1 Tax=Neurospora tetraspora TaxID=94610 RepID=A0AAE0JK13_9PEZI|nr:hypothetical protein B0H65DRAFT_109232 [Neurospora tetraspora]
MARLSLELWKILQFLLLASNHARHKTPKRHSEDGNEVSSGLVTVSDCGVGLLDSQERLPSRRSIRPVYHRGASPMPGHAHHSGREPVPRVTSSWSSPTAPSPGFNCSPRIRRARRTRETPSRPTAPRSSGKEGHQSTTSRWSSGPKNEGPRVLHSG